MSTIQERFEQARDVFGMHLSLAEDLAIYKPGTKIMIENVRPGCVPPDYRYVRHDKDGRVFAKAFSNRSAIQLHCF